jgi:hypothetical protein
VVRTKTPLRHLSPAPAEHRGDRVVGAIPARRRRGKRIPVRSAQYVRQRRDLWNDTSVPVPSLQAARKTWARSSQKKALTGQARRRSHLIATELGIGRERAGDLPKQVSSREMSACPPVPVSPGEGGSTKACEQSSHEPGAHTRIPPCSSAY